MALRILALLLLAAATAEAVITGTVIWARTTTDTIVKTTTDAVIALGNTNTAVFDIDYFKGVATTTATVETTHVVAGTVTTSSDATATIAIVGKVLTITFEIEADTEAASDMYFAFPVTYVKTAGTVDLTLAAVTGTSGVYDETKECTCGKGNAAGSDMSIKMTCDNAHSTNGVDISFLRNADMKFKATPLETNTAKLTKQVDAADAEFVFSDDDPHLYTINAVPGSATTEATEIEVTMGVKSGETYAAYATTHFDIKCGAVAFCHAGTDVHSVGTVDFCPTADTPSGANRAGASVLVLFTVGVSLLI